MNTQLLNRHEKTSTTSHWGIPCVDEFLAVSKWQNPSLRRSLTTSGWLLGLNAVHLGEDMRLYPGPNTVGSSARCNIVVTSPDTGRQHAIVDVLSGESAILHTGSSQRPLFLNNELCNHQSPLQHADTIQIGEQIFAFISLLPQPHEDEKPIYFREKITSKTPCTLGWLLELNGNSQGRDFRLFAGENQIGSQAGLEIFLPDSDIKAKHCVITRHQENWTIVPVSVTEPIIVNGNPSTGTGLENGDVLKIGSREFLFRSIKVGFA